MRVYKKVFDPKDIFICSEIIRFKLIRESFVQSSLTKYKI